MYGRHINWKKKKNPNEQTNKTNLDSVMREMKMIVGEQRKSCSGGLKDQVSFFPESAETDLTKTNFQWNFPYEEGEESS